MFFTLLPATPAFGQAGKIIGELTRSTKSETATNQANNQNDKQVGSGLKEALSIGADHAVNLTGVTDGYFKNEAIKILLPPKLKAMEKGLRMVGGGPQIDELVLGMNRSAEKAAPEARKYFKEAIINMTFADARGILTGGDMAATDYFRAKTSAQLTTAFRPHVETAMAQVGVVKQFNDLMISAKRIPFMKAESLDINQYVVGKAMDGLFYMVGQEEKSIRKNPAAQVTPLLRQVFGSRKS